MQKRRFWTRSRWIERFLIFGSKFRYYDFEPEVCQRMKSYFCFEVRMNKINFNYWNFGPEVGKEEGARSNAAKAVQTHLANMKYKIYIIYLLANIKSSHHHHHHHHSEVLPHPANVNLSRQKQHQHQCHHKYQHHRRGEADKRGEAKLKKNIKVTQDTSWVCHNLHHHCNCKRGAI